MLDDASRPASLQRASTLRLLLLLPESLAMQDEKPPAQCDDASSVNKAHRQRRALDAFYSPSALQTGPSCRATADVSALLASARRRMAAASSTHAVLIDLLVDRLCGAPPRSGKVKSEWTLGEGLLYVILRTSVLPLARLPTAAASGLDDAAWDEVGGVSCGETTERADGGAARAVSLVLPVAPRCWLAPSVTALVEQSRAMWGALRWGCDADPVVQAILDRVAGEPDWATPLRSDGWTSPSSNTMAVFETPGVESHTAAIWDDERDCVNEDDAAGGVRDDAVHRLFARRGRSLSRHESLRRLCAETADAAPPPSLCTTPANTTTPAYTPFAFFTQHSYPAALCDMVYIALHHCVMGVVDPYSLTVRRDAVKLEVCAELVCAEDDAPPTRRRRTDTAALLPRRGLVAMLQWGCACGSLVLRLQRLVTLGASDTQRVGLGSYGRSALEALRGALDMLRRQVLRDRNAAPRGLGLNELLTAQQRLAGVVTRVRLLCDVFAVLDDDDTAALRDVSSATLLSRLHERHGAAQTRAASSTTELDVATMDVLAQLLVAVTRPLHRMLHAWLTHGELHDELDEFFIRAAGRRHDVDPSPHRLPSFLSPRTARRLLHAGLARRALREGATRLLRLTRDERRRLDAQSTLELGPQVDETRQTCRDVAALHDAVEAWVQCEVVPRQCAEVPSVSVLDERGGVARWEGWMRSCGAVLLRGVTGPDATSTVNSVDTGVERVMELGQNTRDDEAVSRGSFSAVSHATQVLYGVLAHELQHTTPTSTTPLVSTHETRQAHVWLTLTQRRLAQLQEWKARRLVLHLARRRVLERAGTEWDQLGSGGVRPVTGSVTLTPHVPVDPLYPVECNGNGRLAKVVRTAVVDEVHTASSLGRDDTASREAAVCDVADRPASACYDVADINAEAFLQQRVGPRRRGAHSEATVRAMAALERARAETCGVSVDDVDYFAHCVQVGRQLVHDDAVATTVQSWASELNALSHDACATHMEGDVGNVTLPPVVEGDETSPTWTDALTPSQHLALHHCASYYDALGRAVATTIGRRALQLLLLPPYGALHRLLTQLHDVCLLQRPSFAARLPAAWCRLLPQFVSHDGAAGARDVGRRLTAPFLAAWNACVVRGDDTVANLRWVCAEGSSCPAYTGAADAMTAESAALRVLDRVKLHGTLTFAEDWLFADDVVTGYGEVFAALVFWKAVEQMLVKVWHVGLQCGVPDVFFFCGAAREVLLSVQKHVWHAICALSTRYRAGLQSGCGEQCTCDGPLEHLAREQKDLVKACRAAALQGPAYAPVRGLLFALVDEVAEAAHAVQLSNGVVSRLTHGDVSREGDLAPTCGSPSGRAPARRNSRTRITATDCIAVRTRVRTSAASSRKPARCETHSAASESASSRTTAAESVQAVVGRQHRFVRDVVRRRLRTFAARTSELVHELRAARDVASLVGRNVGATTSQHAEAVEEDVGGGHDVACEGSGWRQAQQEQRASLNTLIDALSTTLTLMTDRL